MAEVQDDTEFMGETHLPLQVCLCAQECLWVSDRGKERGLRSRVLSPVEGQQGATRPRGSQLR